MFENNITDVINFYNSDISNKNKIIYEEFEKNASNYLDLDNNNIIKNQFNDVLGYGELAFSWNWFLLVNNMPDNFKFLEIGVYKGRVISLIKMISNLLLKNVLIYGITPLDDSGDKYSQYDNIDYLDSIKTSFLNSKTTFDNVSIFKGYSQDLDIINSAKNNGLYDIIFIDGSHDYKDVLLDIKNYVDLIKINGYLVMDDASSLLPDAYGKFLGHKDVGMAIKDKIDNDNRLVHLYAVGHNRIWKKIN